MNDEVGLEIVPEPSPEDRDAILAAVRQVLERQAGLARPAAWRLSGWIGQRVGITDVARWIEPSRLWPSSGHVPRGGRTFPGLAGRGDAR